jgi:hypothetical protein
MSSVKPGDSALQAGKSRSHAHATADLDHIAHFHHVELGYTFNRPWKPRLLFQYDYASGDRDPADDRNGRFDTLYGARRFDFGPTNLYGPFARTNVSSPGVRLLFYPAPAVSGFIAARGYWLASRNDVWAAAGINAPGGFAGSYIGSQSEFMLRWEAVPGNLQLESGMAHLLRGEVMRDAGKEDATFVYMMAEVFF